MAKVVAKIIDPSAMNIQKLAEPSSVSPNVSIEGLGIDVTCPTGPVKIGRNTVIVGNFNYNILNAGDNDEVFDLAVKLSDSDDNNIAVEETSKVIGAHSSIVDEGRNLRLQASYSQAGVINVTIKIELSGAVIVSDSVECNFQVAE